VPALEPAGAPPRSLRSRKIRDVPDEVRDALAGAEGMSSKALREGRGE
jgi:hypothetical protein